MEKKAKAVIDTLIALMEKREGQVREKMAEKNERRPIPNDRFMSGWSSALLVSWEHNLPVPEHGYCGINELTCYYDFNGIHPRVYDMDEQTDTDLTFLTTEIFNEDILPALTEWVRWKVAAEPFGGLYGAQFSLVVTLKTSREVRESDPRHMQGRSWEQKWIKVEDEKRIERRRRAVHDLIAGGEYESEDIEQIDNSLPRICRHAVDDFFGEFGAEKLKAFFEVLVSKAGKARFDSTMSDLLHGFSVAAERLTRTEDGYKPSSDKLELACELCLLILLNGKEKCDRDSGRDYLKAAAAHGSKRAKEILKFGTGQISSHILQYKDDGVTCLANDIEKQVDIKIARETPDSYLAAVRFLIRLLQNGFPGEYSIKCNTRVKSYVDTELKRSKTNNFFANAASYPEVYAALKEYAREAFDDYNYYGDAEDEEAVTCGGYAAMALALADPVENFDIGLEFLEHSDFEHALTSRYFVQDFYKLLKGEQKDKVKKYLDAAI